MKPTSKSFKIFDRHWYAGHNMIINILDDKSSNTLASEHLVEFQFVIMYHIYVFQFFTLKFSKKYDTLYCKITQVLLKFLFDGV